VSTTAPSPVGHAFGRFDILERIGRGGMCDVFRASVRNGSRAGEVVVIKRLSREMAGSPEAVEMFVGEADVSRLLRHRNIIEVFETGQASGESVGGYYIAMEFVDGKDLGAILDRCRLRQILLPVDFSVFLVSQLLDALEYAHNARGPSGRKLGIVHCDVSPGNVFISRFGEIKLGDFGIARVRALETHAAGAREAGLWGKPYYLAPEALRGESPTPATDLWAAAVILYELLTDRRPFEGHTLPELSAAIELAAPVSPADLRPGLPSGLAEVAVTALDAERLRRFGTAREFRSALRPFCDDRIGTPMAIASVVRGLFGNDSP
jgi:eukaryotic-like serine/threonine-protein kinase